MNINLHIERLILDGVDISSDKRHLLRASIADELARLLSSGGLGSDFRQGVSLSRMSTAPAELSGSNPAEFGKNIARSVYGRIGHE